MISIFIFFFFFSSRRRHTRSLRDWSSDVCSSDLGALSPGKANVGIIPAEIFREGSVGLVSRSGTLTYQIGHELAQLGLGNSTIVGIGGDPVVGSSFVDVLAHFESDPQTE